MSPQRFAHAHIVQGGASIRLSPNLLQNVMKRAYIYFSRPFPQSRGGKRGGADDQAIAKGNILGLYMRWSVHDLVVLRLRGSQGRSQDAASKSQATLLIVGGPGYRVGGVTPLSSPGFSY